MISMTGTNPPGPGTKITPADAAYLDAATPRYHIVNPFGQHYTMRMVSDGPGNVLPGQPRTPMVAITVGGQQGEVLLQLSQANLNDLLPGVVNFINNGVLS